MSPLRLILRSAGYYWRTNLAVALGVAAAVSVLAGALLVGDSVRGSLRDIALGRLGRTDAVLASTGFFPADLSATLRQSTGASAAAPLLTATGFVRHEPSSRRASGVFVYGVDERFWSFHGLEVDDGVYVSPALAADLGASAGDVLLIRLQKPSTIPVESLFGRKEDVGRTLRLTLTGVLPRERLGEFALQPQQAEVRAVFAPLSRVQRDLAVPDEANAVLLAGGSAEESAVRRALTLRDLNVTVTVPATGVVAVSTISGIVNDALDRAARDAGRSLGLEPLPVFTYLANTIRIADREVPYSLVAALDLRQLPPPSAPAAAAPEQLPPIVLNDWAARELAAKPGDRVEVDYYLWDHTGGLQTRTAAFRLDRIVPIAGLAADRQLAPEYPGITAANSLADWDPPFPIDLSRVRPPDEAYWDRYRTTAKAFIPYETGRALWQSRYGAATSIRFVLPASGPGQTGAAAVADRMSAALLQSLPPQAMGVTLSPARELALVASTGATDFGEYFTYFSFFLVVSALMLAVLFFKLGIEQRLKQIGILRSAGYTIPAIRRLLLVEALVLAAVGAGIGVVGAIAYAHAIVLGLRTWWVGAVGTTLLNVHVSSVSLAAGAAGGILAAGLCVFVSLRTVGRLSPRLLLTAQSTDADTSTDAQRSRRNRRIAAVSALLGLVLVGVGFWRPAAQSGAFFAAGALFLVASLSALSAWLRARDRRLLHGRGPVAVARLGFRSAAFRPARSVLSAALIASAAFIIVSVDAFRRVGADDFTDRRSGTGGYALIAESEVPIVYNPNDADGRDALLIRAPELSRARFTRFRLRAGQDASCLNLYRPTDPTIIAPEPGFIESGRFSFASSLAESDAERANPWLLLNRRFDDNAVPVIADATSLQYVLHAAVGDTFSVDSGSDRPLRLRFVGALADSVLQGELVMSEPEFLRLFPSQQGYRYFLIEDPAARTAADAAALASVVERELDAFGVDAVTTVDRLDAFHRVENTYLSTFQALGGLGLLLGTVGLATVMFRNVLERRRELALLRAVGYADRAISVVVTAEAALLLGAGLAAGVLCAGLAVAPAWLGRGGTVPGEGLVLLLGAVLVAGLVSALAAARAATTGRMLDALRAE